MKKHILAGLFTLSIFYVGTAFGQNEKKTAYGILLDNTSSLDTQFSYVKNLGRAIVREINEKEAIALFNFEVLKNAYVATGKVGLSWGQNQKDIDKYIDNLPIVYGNTKLSHAIFLASDFVNSKTEQEKDNFLEKILILVTDGEEQVINTVQKKLIKSLKEKKIKVYAIGLLEQLKTKEYVGIMRPDVKAKYFLKKVTQETGGRVIFPKPEQTIEEIIKELFVENVK